MRQEAHACAQLDLRTDDAERTDLDVGGDPCARGQACCRIDLRHA
jgi:hypothetical protein